MPCLLNTQPPDPRYQQFVDEIVGRINGMPSITVYESMTENACATRDIDGNPIIAYNPEFMTNLEYKDVNAVKAVLLHEIGHIYHKHVGGLTFNINHKRELQADHFAGYIMGHKGISLQNALSLFSLYPFTESQTHPHVRKRVSSMKAGWLKADKERNPAKYDRIERERNRNIMRGVAATGLVLIVAGLALRG